VANLEHADGLLVCSYSFIVAGEQERK
jgi:hypothetical protein